MSKFQAFVIGFFVLAIVGGVFSFATYKGEKSQSTLPDITIWGTFPADVFNKYVSDVNNNTSAGLNITYVQYKNEEFSEKFVKALALGNGPDAILLPVEMLLPEMNKLTPIPYSVFPKATFFNTFVDEARVYLSNDGIEAIPFTIDPMVMYWNRDVFNAAGIATYPIYWDEFVGSKLKPGLPQKLTVKDPNGTVKKSALAMGDFSNITNSREIFGTLLLQVSNPVTTIDNNGSVVSTLDSDYLTSSASAVKFFSQFADPANDNYSWNKAMPNDKTAFLSGTLATYFGFASDISNLRSKNPNLNFDVAPLPQLKAGGTKAVYAKMFGFSLVRSSVNLDAAYQVISILTSAENLQTLANTMYLPTVRRDIISQGTSDPYITIFNNAALIAKTWLDVDASQSRQIFGNLIQTIISGKKSVDQALRDTADQYDVILQNASQ